MPINARGSAAITVAIASILAVSGADASDIGIPKPTFSADALNGLAVLCPTIAPRSAEQQAAQFDTRPRDLDTLSATAKRMLDPDNPVGAQFRKRQDAQRASDWPYLCRYREANAMLLRRDARPTAVFMGDSITEGWVEADPSFFADHNYVGRGISGQSSSQMVARFYDDVIALHPRVVHLLAGTNDIGGATGPITEEEYVNNIRAMIDLAQANGIAVVLAGIPPMSRLLPRPEFEVRPMVERVNSRLKQLARARNVPFIDYFAPLADGDGAFNPKYGNDGVHPTRIGYSLMEPLAERAIETALRTRPR